MAFDKQYIVRLISSAEHPISKKELVATIRETGTDRYDTDRKPIFATFYDPYEVDFFGTVVEAAEVETSIQKVKTEFGVKTTGDRQQYINPDIVIVYHADKCYMVQHVYANRLTSDCFRFRDHPKAALKEVREI